MSALSDALSKTHNDYLLNAVEKIKDQLSAREEDDPFWESRPAVFLIAVEAKRLQVENIYQAIIRIERATEKPYWQVVDAWYEKITKDLNHFSSFMPKPGIKTLTKITTLNIRQLGDTDIAIREFIAECKKFL